MPQRSKESSQAGQCRQVLRVDGDGGIHLMDEGAELFHLLHHEFVIEMGLIGDVVNEFVMPALLAHVVAEEAVSLLEGRDPGRRKRLQAEEFLGGYAQPNI